MARNPDITISSCLGRREYGVQHRKGPPIREEMAVHVMSPWILAEIEMAVGLRCEAKFWAWSNVRLRFEKVTARRARRGTANRGEELSRGGRWRAAAAVGFPDIAVALPVHGEGTS